MVSGIVTSRAIFSFGSASRWPVLRSTRRRNAASDRSRTSSAENALTTVSRPRRFSPPPRVGLGVAAGRAATPRLAVRGASSSSASNAGRAPGFATMASDPNGFFAFIPGAGLFLGAFPLFVFAQPRIGERMRTRVAFVFGQRAKDDAGCFWRYAGSPGRGRACAGASHRLWRCAGAFRRGSAIRYCRFRLGFARTGNAALYLLDYDGLAAAMAEALAHHALFHAAAL